MIQVNKNRNYRIFALLLLLLCCNIKAKAQTTQIDSLEKWVATYTKKDTVWVKNLIELERAYYIHQPQNIGKYAQDIINTSKELSFPKGILRGYTALVYKNIENGKYTEAVKVAFKKLKYAEAHKQIFEIATSYSQLGYCYSLMENFEESITYYNLAIEYGKKLPLNYPNRDRTIIGHISNLTLSYNKLKKYDKSILLLLDAYKTIRQHEKNNNEYYYLEAVLLLNIGNTYTQLEEFELSNKYLLKGLQIVKNRKIVISLPRFYLAFCGNYIKLKQYDKANEMLQILKELKAKKKLNTDGIIIYYDFLEQVKEEQHKFEEAYYAFKERTALNDSIKTVEQKKIVQELSIQYETEQKVQQNKLLQAQNDKINARNQVSLITITATLLLLAMSLFFYLQLRAKNNKLDKLNQIKDRLFAIIAHDLKRPVNTFQNLIPVIKFVLDKKQYHRLYDVFSQAQLIAVDMNLVLDNLFRWSLSQQNKIVVRQEDTEIAPIIADIQAEFEPIAELKNINFKISCPTQVHILIDKTILTAILRNLLSNALKFTAEGGVVSMNVFIEKNKTHFSVGDTGIGIPESIIGKLFDLDSSKRRDGTAGEPGSGLGLLLTKELVELQNGTISIKTQEGKGSEFIISFVH